MLVLRGRGEDALTRGRYWVITEVYNAVAVLLAALSLVQRRSLIYHGHLDRDMISYNECG